MPSFSIKLINLFVGLFTARKDRFLKEYSSKIDGFGYKLVEIEPTFTTESGRVNPEAIVYSSDKNQSIQIEWTQLNEPNPAKINQINRYLRVRPQHISVKTNALPKAVSTWLIADDQCEPSYHCLLDTFADEIDKRLMLCSFISNSDGNSLQRTRGSFEDLDFSSFMQQGILIKRIPYDYVKIDLHNLQSPEILSQIVRQLVNFYARQKPEFTSEEIASEAFGSAWNLLSQEKKRSLKKRALEILNDFSNYAGRKHIERVMSEPPTWIFKGGLPSFQNKASEYIRSKNSKS